MEATKTKEVVALEKTVNNLTLNVENLVVGDDESMLLAAELRKEIKVYAKEVKEEKEKATKPLKEVVKTITSWFAPMEEKCEKAVSAIEVKMRGYQDVVDAKNRKIAAEAAKKLAEAEAALKAGEITEEKAEKIVAKVEAKIEAAPAVITKSADFHTRTNRKVRFSSPIGLTKIEIVQLVVGGYLVWDEVKARKDVLAGVVIPGTEIYEEQSFV